MWLRLNKAGIIYSWCSLWRLRIPYLMAPQSSNYQGFKNTYSLLFFFFCLPFLFLSFTSIEGFCHSAFQICLFLSHQVHLKPLFWNLTRNDKESWVGSTEHPPRMMTPKLKAFFNHHNGVNDVDISTPTYSHWWICSWQSQHRSVTATMVRGRELEGEINELIVPMYSGGQGYY